MKAVLAALFLALPAHAASPAVVPAVRRATVAFPNGTRIKAEVADTPESRERGLMFRQAMAADDGMLFVFERDEALAFWMKNTFVDLDMVWLDKDGVVTVVHANVPRSKPGMRDDEVATRAGRGLYVLELAAGQARRRKVKVGSKLKLSLEAPR